MRLRGVCFSYNPYCMVVIYKFLSAFAAILIFAVCFSSCSANSESDGGDSVRQVQNNATVSNNYSCPQASEAPAVSPSHQSSNQTNRTIPSTTTTRSDAFRFAFDSGKQSGYSDGLKGENNCSAMASVYSDDWIKQAFIQGYELGQAEAGSESAGSEGNEYVDCDDDYYYEDDY